jgi:predicted ester cyclase
MDRQTQESFNQTYKGLLDSLNEKKKTGIKPDFDAELKVYERDHKLDTDGFFKVCRIPT